MAELFLKIVNMSISAGWIVLAVLLLRLLLKKAPKWIPVLLWGIVAVRLMLPVTVESSFSLMPSAETVSPGIMLDPVPEIQTGIPVLNDTLNPIISSSFAPDPASSANPLQILIPVFAILWIAGMVLMLAYTAVTYWRLRRRVHTAVRMKGNIFQSELVVSPFVLGIFCPRIYLPFAMNGQDMTHVIAHEQAHLRRKDHLWKPLGFLLLTVYWFHPLMWIAYALLCRDIELACDEKVVKTLDTQQRADYSEALLTCSVNRRMIAACPLAFGEMGVKNRVKSVLNYKKPAFWIVVTAILVSAAVAVCFLTDPKEQVKDVLKPNTHWMDSSGSITFSVTETLAIEGSFSIGEKQETVSIGYRFAGSNAVAEVFRGDWAHAQSAAEDPILKGLFTMRKGGLVFEIEKDGVGLGTDKLFFQTCDREDEVPGEEEEDIMPGILNAPLLIVTPESVANLKEKYPMYFDLPTDNGLRVIVWQMAEGHYAFGLLSGSSAALSAPDIWDLPGVSLESMRIIVASYNLPKSNIQVTPVRNPLSSYWYSIDATYQQAIEFMFWSTFVVSRPSDVASIHIDNAVFDIDRDGLKEVVQVSFYVDAGVSVFNFVSVEFAEGERIDHRGSFHFPYSRLHFSPQGDGETLLCGVLDGKAHYYQIRTEGENIILTEIDPE